MKLLFKKVASTRNLLYACQTVERKKRNNKKTIKSDAICQTDVGLNLKKVSTKFYHLFFFWFLHFFFFVFFVVIMVILAACCCFD